MLHSMLLFTDLLCTECVHPMYWLGIYCVLHGCFSCVYLSCENSLSVSMVCWLYDMSELVMQPYSLSLVKFAPLLVLNTIIPMFPTVINIWSYPRVTHTEELVTCLAA